MSPEASEDDLNRLDSVVLGILKSHLTCGLGGLHQNRSVTGGKGMTFCHEGTWSVLGFELILKGKCYCEIYSLGSTLPVADVLLVADASATLSLKTLSATVFTCSYFLDRTVASV